MRTSIIFSILTLPLSLMAAPSDHGRPWDDANYHSSPISKILIPIAIIALIILAICWIANNKESIAKLLKNGFSILCVGALVFGFIILPLLDRADRDSYSTSTSSTTNTSLQENQSTVQQQPKPKEGEIGYKTKTYRVDVCRTCKGTGRYTVEANWGKTTVSCPTCHGSGKERVAGNYR